VTSQKEQIQILITEIDSVLQRTNPRLPWVMSGEAIQQRQLLERVRNYLVALQQRLPSDEGLGGGTSLMPQAPSTSAQIPPSPDLLQVEGAAEMTPYQMMQMILRDVSYLRANLTPVPTQSPLNQQQLTAELLQVLMSRLQENLSQQIAQTLGNLRSQPLPYEPNAMLPGGVSVAGLGNPQASSQYEQLQNLRSRSDQMLVNLDSTLTVVFESLQRNIQAYQEALSQGLERMYSMGQQSEYTFKMLIDQLAEQLKQEASSYLQSSLKPVPEAVSPPTESVSAPEITQSPQPQSLSISISPSPSIASPSITPAVDPLPPTFPYAGTEFLSSEISGSDLTTPTEPIVETKSTVETDETLPAISLDSAIEAWLQSVSKMNRSTDTQEQEPLDLPELDLSSLELGEVEPDLPNTAMESSVADTVDTVDHETAEIDAALKLLEDLSAEIDNPTDSFLLENAEAQLDQMLVSSAADELTDTATEIPNDARDELDEFYQSLFGSEAATTPPVEAPSSVEEPIPSPAELESIFPSLPVLSPPESSEPTRNISAEVTEAEPPMFLDLPDDLFEPASFEPEREVAIAPPSLPSLDESITSDADEFISLADLFQNVTPEAAHSVPTEPPGVSPPPFSTTLSATDSQTLFLSDDLFGGDSSLESTEDQFTRAAPDENLLPDASIQELSSSLDLDELTLSSLSQDLSSLEKATETGEFADVFDQEMKTSPELTLEAFATDVTQATAQSTSPDDQNMLSLDEFAAALGDSPAVAPAPVPYYQASPAIADITIEGFAQLFDNDTTQPEPLPAQPINSVEPLPFTLEGTTNLFEEQATAPTAQPLVPPSPNDEQLTPFTLEGMDDLFGEAAPLPPLPVISTENSSPAVKETAEKTPFTIEGMNDLFEDAPAIASTPPPKSSVRSVPVTPPIREIPPFKPELPTVNDSTETLPPFELEQLDNLFADTTSNASSAIQAKTPDRQSLDAAFESLLGSPPPTASESNPSQQTGAKKKRNFLDSSPR